MYWPARTLYIQRCHSAQFVKHNVTTVWAPYLNLFNHGRDTWRKAKQVFITSCTWWFCFLLLVSASLFIVLDHKAELLCDVNRWPIVKPVFLISFTRVAEFGAAKNLPCLWFKYFSSWYPKAAFFVSILVCLLIPPLLGVQLLGVQIGWWCSDLSKSYLRKASTHSLLGELQNKRFLVTFLILFFFFALRSFCCSEMREQHVKC